MMRESKTHTLTVSNRSDVKDGDIMMSTNLLVTVGGLELMINSIEIGKVDFESGFVDATIKLPIKFK